METGSPFYFMLRAKEYSSTDYKSIPPMLVFAHYLKAPVVLGKMYRSPLRKDVHPTCSFWYNQNHDLYLHDFGTGEMYSALEFVKRLFKISYAEAARKIVEEVKRVPIEEPQRKEKTNVYDFAVSPLSEGMTYWNSFHIPKEVVSKYCFNAKAIYLNQSLVSRATAQNPIYVYKAMSGHLKIYRPLSPDRAKKWGGNWDSSDIGGLYQLPKRGRVLFITSSVKDVMVLHQHGFPAICFNGEGVGSGQEGFAAVLPHVRGLKRRFENIILFLDNDEAGVKHAAKLATKLKVRSITLWGRFKDISDYQRHYGVRRTYKQIKSLVKK